MIRVEVLSFFVTYGNCLIFFFFFFFFCGGGGGGILLTLTGFCQEMKR